MEWRRRSKDAGQMYVILYIHLQMQYIILNHTVLTKVIVVDVEWKARCVQVGLMGHQRDAPRLPSFTQEQARSEDDLTSPATNSSART